MSRQSVNPKDLFNSLQYGFSQITVATGSRIITISGQVGWDAEENIVGAGDLEAQTLRALQNLERAIVAVGGTLDTIVSLRLYIVDSAMEDLSPISAALRTFFPDSPPTATWIGVPRLANKAFLIEIEALAVMP
jgi:enamine deaminase RidA (YjgF/YER057c/UK114 family)